MIIELISKGRYHSIKCCGANEHISLSTRTFVSLAPPTERQKIFAANFLVLFKKLFCRDFIFSFQHFLFRNENSFCFKESEQDMFLSQQKKMSPCLSNIIPEVWSQSTKKLLRRPKLWKNQLYDRTTRALQQIGLEKWARMQKSSFAKVPLRFFW